MDLLTTFQKQVPRPARPDVRPGDTVRVRERVKEGGKERIAAFEGLVIARRHRNEPGATITVRKISYGVGVERVFPFWAPTIQGIEILRRAKTRRAKLNFIRKRVGKRATLKGELVPPEIGQAEAVEEEAAPQEEEAAPQEEVASQKAETAEEPSAIEEPAKK